MKRINKWPGGPSNDSFRHSVAQPPERTDPFGTAQLELCRTSGAARQPSNTAAPPRALAEGSEVKSSKAEIVRRKASMRYASLPFRWFSLQRRSNVSTKNFSERLSIFGFCRRGRAVCGLEIRSPYKTSAPWKRVLFSFVFPEEERCPVQRLADRLYGSHVLSSSSIAADSTASPSSPFVPRAE